MTVFQHTSKHLKIHQKYCAGEFFCQLPSRKHGLLCLIYYIIFINFFSQESYLHDLMAQKLVFMILSSADIAVHYV